MTLAQRFATLISIITTYKTQIIQTKTVQPMTLFSLSILEIISVCEE